jgi:hypothetical protein
MDAYSQITYDAALVVRLATWLRGQAPGLPYRNISATAIHVPCDALDVPAANPMAGGWAEEPGADQRFGAWFHSMAWGGRHHANLIHNGRALYHMFGQPGSSYLCSTARFVRASALMPLLGPENPDCPEFISLKSPQYIFLSRIVLFRLNTWSAPAWLFD